MLADTDRDEVRRLALAENAGRPESPSAGLVAAYRAEFGRYGTPVRLARMVAEVAQMERIAAYRSPV